MNEIFTYHAKEILGNPRYEYWEEIKKGKPGSGIMCFSADPEGIVRTWKIVPSDNYPEKSPIIAVEPHFGIDPFDWNNGTIMIDDRIWTELIQNTDNPLDILLHELMEKFHVGI